MAACFSSSVVDDRREVVLQRSKSCSARINLFGGTVVSWINEAGREMLFVSQLSKFDNQKAIRGGIPIVFPKFGPWKLGPQHGFARIKMWQVVQGPTTEANGDVKVVLKLDDDEETRKIWDYKFSLVYTVLLQDKSLVTSLKIVNTGCSFFDFTCLLHTYFSVADVTKCAISGLKGIKFIDKVNYENTGEEVEVRPLVRINELTDRIYVDSPDEQEVTSPGTDTSSRTCITICKSNLPDTVVWNPWDERSKQMSDFGDDEYKVMVCVEAGRVGTPAALAAGQEYVATQILTIRDNH